MAEEALEKFTIGTEYAESIPQRLNRLRKNSGVREKLKGSVPRGLKPTFIFSHLRPD
jgi:hypothetical protein